MRGANSIVPALLLLLSAAPAGAQVATLVPVDEAAQRPDFFSFRAQLQSAIARRDAAALLAVVDPAIRISFGDEGGIDDFRRQWKLDEAGGRDSELWSELGAVLAFGGSFEGDRFSAPYVFSRWPSGYDSFEHVAIVGERVRVRAEGRSDAPVVGRLDFAIVPRARVTGHGPADGEGWTPIRLRDGTGYVSSALVRGPVDYRAIFARGPGGWRLEAFVAGD